MIFFFIKVVYSLTLAVGGDGGGGIASQVAGANCSRASATVNLLSLSLSLLSSRLNRGATVQIPTYTHTHVS